MQMPIAAAIGMGVPSLSRPMTAVATAPARNWINPSSDEAVKILEGLAPRYEKHHGVHYTLPALRACVELRVIKRRNFVPARPAMVYFIGCYETVGNIETIGVRGRISRLYLCNHGKEQH